MTVAVDSVVKGESLNIAQFLKENHHIPDYQRDFTWNSRRIAQLWLDLIDLYRKNSVNDVLVAKPEGYYLGAVVTIAQKGSPDDVVDGQQRLTALTTLAAVLADAVRALPVNKQPHALLTTLEQLITQGLVGGKSAARLTFADSEMNDFYRESTILCISRKQRAQYWESSSAAAMLKRAKGKSPMALLKAAFETHYDQLDRFLDEVKPNKRAGRLALFAQIFGECVVVLKISAGSYSNAYSIFESLNFRGAPLSQADLIKNELLKQASASGRIHITTAWREIKELAEDAESVNLPELIYLSHLSRYKKINGSQLFEDVKSKAASQAKSVAYIDGVKADAEALVALKKDQPSYWTDDTKWALKDIFDVLGAKLAIPFLLAAYRHKGLHKNSAAEFESLVKTCMNFTFRYMKLGDGDTSTFSKATNEAALSIAQNKLLTSISSSLRAYAPDHEFREQFEKFSTTRPKLAYFSVYWIEREIMAGKGVVPLQHGIHQNIEHIMPKKPDINWPAATNLKAQDPDDFDYQLWRVGNLIPLPAGINKSIKNKAISYKLAAYKNANLDSPKQIAKYLNGGAWDKVAIDKRQKALAAIAVSAWIL